MILVRSLLAWIGRHFLLLLLILGLLLLYQQLWPRLGAEISRARALPEQQQSYADAQRRFDAWRAERAASAEKQAAGLAGMPRQGLEARLAANLREQKSARKQLRSAAGLAAAAVGGDGRALFGHYRSGAELALLGQEERLIRDLLQSRNQVPFCQEPLAECRRRLALDHNRLKQEEMKRRRQAEGLTGGALNSAHLALCRSGADFGCARFDFAAQLTAEADQLEQRTDHLRTLHALVGARIEAEAARRRLDDGGAQALAAAGDALAKERERVEEAVQGNWVRWAVKPLLALLPQALGILFLIILSPLLIKALAYFVIAPLAAGRRRVRLVPSDDGRASGSGSAVTRQVMVEPDQELLVLPEYLQASPDEAAKATQWLLDWSVPLSSLASGMVALTRIRTRVPAPVAVSALKDPLSEIGIVSLAPGAAMVFRPRSLVGLVKPVGAPVAISRHWRLGHLSAWLTFQLRFLIIHGPCDLIVQGSRGVRLEPAADGRSINQAATLGFSAGLDYGVRRSETFGAYLLGKQGLFIDSFRGEGVYLYEEMPRAGKKSGLWGRGFEGATDAFLSLFGL